MAAFFFGSNGSLQALESHIPKIARARLPVLIQGERGTGKRTLAEHLHAQAGKGRLRVVPCHGGGPTHFSELVRSASSQRDTWLLEHVDELIWESQGTVLKILDEHPEAWVIATVTGPLGQRAEAKAVMPELCRRISGYGIELPPLRERPQDIVNLFQVMLARQGFVDAGAKPMSRRLAEALQSYGWPGNFWELENIAHLYMAAGSEAEVTGELERRAIRGKVVEPAEAAGSFKERVREAVKGVEAEIILRTLEKHHWNRRRAAQTLQISYRALLYKMKNCGIRESGLQAAMEEK